MSKRTPEEIIQSVERYQQRETSQGAEAKRLGVSQQSFQDWIRKYETFGEKVFRRTEKRRYSKELKLSAVQAYLDGEESQAAICKKYARSTLNTTEPMATAELRTSTMLPMKNSTT